MLPRHVRILGFAWLVSIIAAPAVAAPQGEAVNGFPNWGERVLHEWTNRARCDPVVEMAACGSNCLEGACYTPKPPLAWSLPLNRSARFHCDEMSRQSYLGFDSLCVVPLNIDSLYPGSCDGSASCACAGAMPPTTWLTRISYFGASPMGEIVAPYPYGDPNAAFYAWLFEMTTSPACGFHIDNGHRYLILSSTGSMGAGVATAAPGGPRETIDFGSGGTPTRIASGSHFPRQAASVDAWANWYDAAAPLAAWVVVDDTWLPLSLARGTGTNGAWSATIPGVGTGCHRYYFAFLDSTNALVRYPGMGTLGIGPEGSCADWDPDPPTSACVPGQAGVLACPCSNPPGGLARGCNNKAATGGASITGTGLNFLSNPTLSFTTAGENPTVLSIMMQGTVLTTGSIFGHGVRCMTSFKRMYQKNSVSGSVTMPDLPADPDIPARSAALGNTILAGEKRWYQVYYRDNTLLLPGCPLAATAFNVTSSQEATWIP